ncbi:MAG TPA: DUF86 domain-containing protein [Thermoanaerobaculia bacterium]|nr:DUF86 domain-containing protein [Thermoanaerobaculia bacterium]
MAPEVVTRKLSYLRRLLGELQSFSGASLEDVLARNRELERIFELLVTAGADLLQHLLSERDITASSYREVYARAGEVGLIPATLSARLEKAAQMRNVIVHLYEDIDYERLRGAIDPALSDFATIIAALEAQLPASNE